MVKAEFEPLNILDFIEAQAALRNASSYTFIKKRFDHPKEYITHIQSFIHSFSKDEEKPSLEQIPFSSIVQSAMGIFLSPIPMVDDPEIKNDLSTPTKAFQKFTAVQQFREEFSTRMEAIEESLISLYGKENKDFIEKNLEKAYMTEIIKMIEAKHNTPPNILSFHIRKAAHAIRFSPDGFLQAFSSAREILDFVHQYAKEIGIERED